MAQALAATDKAAALGLLDEAFRELEGLRARGRVSQFASISGVAGGLLPIVEQVDPDRLPEYLARAVALRPPQNEGKDLSWIPEQAAPLAMMVARYDRSSRCPGHPARSRKPGKGLVVLRRRRSQDQSRPLRLKR